MNLNQVTVTVDDLEAAITFYQRLGLVLIVHTHERYARFECLDGGATFSLHLGSKPGPDGPAIYFEVDDVQKKYAELVDQGVVFDRAPEAQRWRWEEAWLCDPAGNRLCIYHAGENRRFPPWRHPDAPKGR